MKKTYGILGGAFVVLLVAGIVMSAQSGLYWWDDFWRAQGDSVYANGRGGRIECVREGAEAVVSLRLNGRETTAALSKMADGGWRWDFSDGWAVEYPRAGEAEEFWKEAGIVYGWDDGAEPLLIPLDLEAMGCRFGAATGVVREPFYDEDDEPVGESVFLRTAEGETVYLGEEWYGGTSETGEPVRVQEGRPVSANEGGPYQNERGEYLLDPQALFSVEMGEGLRVDRIELADFLRRVAAGETERRGDGSAIWVFIFCYLGGAALWLWPEELAFLGSRWMYRNEPELSEEGIFFQRLGGVLLLGAGVVVLLGSFFLH